MEKRIERMLPLLNERQRRLFLANEAIAYGHGGIVIVSNISKMSRTTITRGVRELNNNTIIDGKIRCKGGGRHSKERDYPGLENRIHKIIDEVTYGDPTRILSYTTKSLRKISAKLKKDGTVVNYVTVGKILENMGYSKQANQKMLQIGKAHPNRDAQFEHINNTAYEYIQSDDPVISVDTKKKELIGNFKNNGQEYCRRGEPRKVLDHDFPIEELGKIAPYGIYNVNNNVGFMNLGTSHDTGEFAVESISRWWETIGKHTFRDKKRIYITCDSGGSNSTRARMWKYQLQQFANRTRLEVEVSHYPPGTSKWNKIEHRLFCYISKSWQGKPLIDIQTAINLIGSTTTTAGLSVICVQDNTRYEIAQKVSDEDFNTIIIERIMPYDIWNYRIIPR